MRNGDCKMDRGLLSFSFVISQLPFASFKLRSVVGSPLRVESSWR